MRTCYFHNSTAKLRQELFTLACTRIGQSRLAQCIAMCGKLASGLWGFLQFVRFFFLFVRIFLNNRMCEVQEVCQAVLKRSEYLLSLKTLHFCCMNAKISLFCLKISIYIIFGANVAKISTYAQRTKLLIKNAGAGSIKELTMQKSLLLRRRSKKDLIM